MKTKRPIQNLLPKGRRSSRRNRPEFATEEGIARRYAEGRGLGDGPDYKSWLRVPEFPSRGFRVMVWSPKLGRIVHLFSILEWAIFIYAERESRFTSIRENYPLDRLGTLLTATALGIRHPNVFDCDIVMTTDMLITEQTESGPILHAWFIKYDHELTKPRVQEKLKIERAHHEAEGTRFTVKTELSVPSAIIKNLEYIRDTLIEDAMDDYSPELLQQIDDHMRPHLASIAFGDLCEGCDGQLNLEPGTAAFAVRYFIASERWFIDLKILITPESKLQILPTS